MSVRRRRADDRERTRPGHGRVGGRPQRPAHHAQGGRPHVRPREARRRSSPRLSSNATERGGAGWCLNATVLDSGGESPHVQLLATFADGHSVFDAISAPAGSRGCRASAERRPKRRGRDATRPNSRASLRQIVSVSHGHGHGIELGEFVVERPAPPPPRRGRLRTSLQVSRTLAHVIAVGRAFSGRDEGGQFRSENFFCFANDLLHDLLGGKNALDETGGLPVPDQHVVHVA